MTGGVGCLRRGGGCRPSAVCCCLVAPQGPADPCSLCAHAHHLDGDTCGWWSQVPGVEPVRDAAFGVLCRPRPCSWGETGESTSLCTWSRVMVGRLHPLHISLTGSSLPFSVHTACAGLVLTHAVVWALAWTHSHVMPTCCTLLAACLHGHRHKHKIGANRAPLPPPARVASADANSR